MKNLLNSRRRYQSMLDALGADSITDNCLRDELQTTIAAIDQKLARFSSLPGEDGETELTPARS